MAEKIDWFVRADVATFFNSGADTNAGSTYALHGYDLAALALKINMPLLGKMQIKVSKKYKCERILGQDVKPFTEKRNLQD